MIRMLSRAVNRRSLVLVLGEAVLIAGAVVVGAWVRLGDGTWILFADAQG